MSALSLDQAVRLSERFACWALIVSAMELLRVQRALRDDAVFAWPVLRRDFSSAPWALRRLLDALLSYRAFVALLCMQLLAALVALGVESAMLPVALLGMQLLVAVRFRGAYNGGSDAMLLVVLIGVSVARVVSSPSLRVVGLAYIAAQLVLSYFIAGIAKLREPTWRTGSALPRVLRLRPYAAPSTVLRLVGDRRAALFASWGVITLECAFPLALGSVRACAVVLSFALVFHVANVVVLGLNRFLWAWLAAYPALLYFSQN